MTGLKETRADHAPLFAWPSHRDAAAVFAEFSREFEAEHGEGSARKGGFVLASGQYALCSARGQLSVQAHPFSPTVASSGSGSAGGAPKAYEPSRAASAFNRNPKVSAYSLRPTREAQPLIRSCSPVRSLGHPLRHPCLRPRAKERERWTRSSKR